MRVLLTNNTLDVRAGTELYVRDVAVELLRRGHKPVAYSTRLGQVARELREATVPVISKLEMLGEEPDLIHGQHHYETLSAMLHFPRTPAISYCHGWLPWEEAPLRFPRILQYVAVDEVCRERLIAEGGIDPSKIDLLLNFFDSRLFPPRGPLPEKPLNALAFSNLFSEAADLPVLREACDRQGIELHAAGLAARNVETDTGALLAKYDIVFAKARAAIEAMAVGAAVVLCNPGRLGPLVTARKFASLRPLNFGIRTLDRPLEMDGLMEELRGYNSADAAMVSQKVRAECELRPAVDRIIELYERVIAEARTSPLEVSIEGDRAAARYLEDPPPRFKESALEVDRNRWVKRCLAAETALRELASGEAPLPQDPNSAFRDPLAAHVSDFSVIEGGAPGFLESLEEKGDSLWVRGWAIQPGTRRPATHVMFADREGRIFGTALVGAARSDVALVHGAEALNSGFDARIGKPAGGTAGGITCLSFTLGEKEAFSF